MTTTGPSVTVVSPRPDDSSIAVASLRNGDGEERGVVCDERGVVGDGGRGES
jgi:hypothetical protein